jgi:hypothetical protein
MSHPIPTTTPSAAASLLLECWHAHTGQVAAVDSDDFFASGGDSMSAIRMLVAITRGCGVDLDVDAFFAEPTLGTLRGLVEAAIGVG